MAQVGKTLLRVLRSYSIEEKVISLVVAALVLVLTFQAIVDWVTNPFQLLNDGGMYTEGIVTERPALLNPVYADFSDANRDAGALLFSGLTRYDPTVQAFVEDLAELSISEDRMIYTFTVRNDVLWHDGQPLTAADVFFTYHDVIQHPHFQNPVLLANFEGVEVKQLDDQTVSFTLAKPNSFFITNLNVGILPKHILEGVAVADLPQDSFNVQPIGTGPYMVNDPLETLDDGRQRVTLMAFDGYYGQNPQIEQIRFHMYPTTELMDMELSTLNVIAKVPFDIMEGLGESGRFQLEYYELPQYTAVFFNMDSPLLVGDKMRIALQKAINKEELLALLPDKIAVDTPLMALDQSEWLYQSNIEEARGALFDSGYRLNENNSDDPYRKNREGENVKLKLLVQQLPPGAMDELQTTVDFVVEAWKNVGIEVEPHFAQLDSFSEQIQQRDYDLLLTGQSLGHNLDMYAYWHSSEADAGGLNLSNYKSFTADSLIEKIRNTFEVEEKDVLLEDLAETIATEVPAIFLYRPRYSFATDRKVQHGSLEGLAAVSDRFADIAKWCIECGEG